MKLLKLTKTMIAAATVTLGQAALANDAYQKGQYQIDAAHSKVGFEIAHLVISTVDGRFTKFDGTLEMAEKFEKSKVKMEVDIASINTGVDKRDDHLRSPDFFDASKHPKMKFSSTEIKGQPGSFKLTGDLTIKGITKKVTFDAKYLGTAADGFGNKKAAFAATATIKRKDFGLTWNNVVEAGPVVGDDVKLDLRIQGAMPEPKTKQASR